MMILVDYREDSKKKGSRGLWDDLKHTSLPIEQSSLEGGDLMFLGKGPEGKEVTVGVEFKRIRDLLSSLRSGRLQGVQLDKLQQYDFRFLLVEGEWRHNDSGQVVLRSGWREWKVAPGGWSASELDKRLLGLTLRRGVYVQTAITRRDTVRWLESLYRDFTDVAWDEHTSHIAVHRPVSLVSISEFRETVSTFPGIGIKTSKNVEQYFCGSIRRAVKARAAEWQKIEGIGAKGAAKIDAFLEGE